MPKKKSACYRCGKNAGGPKTIFFEYKGLRFKEFKDGLTCAQCIKAKKTKMFDEYCQDIVTCVDGKAKVDWSSYFVMSRNDRSGERERKVLRILHELGILRHGNGPGRYWEICRDEGVSCNPQFFGFFYFVRKEDAQAYAGAELAEYSDKDKRDDNNLHRFLRHITSYGRLDLSSRNPAKRSKAKDEVTNMTDEEAKEFERRIQSIPEEEIEEAMREANEELTRKLEENRPSSEELSKMMQTVINI